MYRVKLSFRPPRLPRFGPEVRTVEEHVRLSERMRKELEHFFGNLSAVVVQEPVEIELTYNDDDRVIRASSRDWKVDLHYNGDVVGRATEVYDDYWIVDWSLTRDSRGRVVRVTPFVRQAG